MAAWGESGPCRCFELYSGKNVEGRKGNWGYAVAAAKGGDVEPRRGRRLRTVIHESLGNTGEGWIENPLI